MVELTSRGTREIGERPQGPSAQSQTAGEGVMGLFGPSKTERISRSIEELAAGAPDGPAARYLRSHPQEAWPQLEAALLSAAAPDPAVSALAALQPSERDLLNRLDAGLPHDLTKVPDALTKGGMSKEDVAQLMPLIVARRDPHVRHKQAAAVLRFCLTLLDQPGVAAPACSAAFALLGCGVGTVEAAACEALEAIGPPALPLLLRMYGAGRSGVETAVCAVGRRHPEALAAACREATEKDDVLAGLAVLRLVGKEAHPAIGWVSEMLHSRKHVQEEAFAAAMAIGPAEECVASAAALLAGFPKRAAELLCAVRPAGVEALAGMLPELSDEAAVEALAALKAIRADGHAAAIAVADVARQRPSLIQAALQTLDSIGPTPGCVEVAAAALAGETAIASSVLCKLGEAGIRVLAERAREMDNDTFLLTLPALMAAKDEAAALVPRTAAMLTGEKRFAEAAMRALAAIGPAARAAAPEILAHFQSEASEAVAIEMAHVADPSFLEPLLGFVYNTPRSNRSKLEAAMRAFAATTRVSADVLETAVKASTFEHLFRGWQYDAGVIDLKRSDAAVGALVANRDPAVTNILHHVAQKKDVSVTMDTGCSEPWEETVSFAAQRGLAQRELAARGDPPYDAAHYVT